MKGILHYNSSIKIIGIKSVPRISRAMVQLAILLTFIEIVSYRIHIISLKLLSDLYTTATIILMGMFIKNKEGAKNIEIIVLNEIFQVYQPPLLSFVIKGLLVSISTDTSK